RRGRAGEAIHRGPRCCRPLLPRGARHGPGGGSRRAGPRRRRPGRGRPLDPIRRGAAGGMTDGRAVARIEAAEGGFAIEIPEVAASGAPVELERDEQDGARRLHSQTPDGSEVYVEVLAGASAVDHAVACADQQRFLRERATVESLTDPAPSLLGGRPASTF